jgi:hypothetical protein
MTVKAGIPGCGLKVMIRFNANLIWLDWRCGHYLITCAWIGYPLSECIALAQAYLREHNALGSLRPPPDSRHRDNRREADVFGLRYAGAHRLRRPFVDTNQFSKAAAVILLGSARDLGKRREQNKTLCGNSTDPGGGIAQHGAGAGA